MSRRRHGIAGRLARAGAGAIAGGAGAAGALLAGQFIAAARRDPTALSDPPPITGTFGISADPPLRLAVLGDSTAAGYGVSRVEQSVPGQLAARLAAAGWRVELSGFAIAGSRTGDLGPQVSRALLSRPDLAVLVIGADDALRLTRSRSVSYGVVDAVRRLRDHGVPVVVGTAPDLAAARGLGQPLRIVAGWRSRRVAKLQLSATRAAGGLPVDLAKECGPVFRADPGLLSDDGWHPSVDGARIWVDALEPMMLDAAGSPATY
ncbi:MAG: SGNH/GDSL hydrolase family protein [Actinomycetota bacterium]|nr:SGNH/GDSL hydrolase family protein [Actinomycetota bacterium]